jgi:predicted NAD-dependent protein-ADP-ribosyltransferase YbiA (DUF1768 family)
MSSLQRSSSRSRSLSRSKASSRSRSRSVQSRSRSRSASRQQYHKRSRSVSPYEMKSTSYFKFTNSGDNFKKLQLKNDDYDVVAEGIRASSVQRCVDKLLPVFCRVGQCDPEKVYQDCIYDWIKKAYLHKCANHESVTKQLMTSENRVIVYCNPDDTILSCGLAIDDDNVNDPTKWKGKNILGLVLMEIRCILKEEWKSLNLDRKGRFIKKFKKN